jgi:hypothetical protein
MSAAKNTRRIGSESRTDRLRKLDGRTKVARRLRTITMDLVVHVGGQPSAAQRYLIDRLAIDILRLELLDAKMAAGNFSEHDGRVAHALRNSMRLSLRELGLAPQSPQAPSLADYLRSKSEPGAAASP